MQEFSDQLGDAYLQYRVRTTTVALSNARCAIALIFLRKRLTNVFVIIGHSVQPCVEAASISAR